VLSYIVDTCPGTNPLTASGDTYFIYDPDRDLPPNRQLPFATLITGDRHDAVSRLDRDGVYRLNIGVHKQTYRDLFGVPPTERDDGGLLRHTGYDFAATDVLLPHPVYASQYWVCVLSPSAATFESLRPLLAEAYELALRKHGNWTARRDG
jgi:hypothetical protein